MRIRSTSLVNSLSASHQHEVSHPSMDRTSFDNLPYEVQTMVISHLTQFELASCTRVCKAWNKMTLPFLWRHIRDPPPTYKIDDSNDDDDDDNDIYNFNNFNYDEYNKPRYDHHDTMGVKACARSGALEKNGHLVESIDIETSMFFLDSFLTGCPTTFPRLTSLSIDGAEYGDGSEYVNDESEKDLAQLLDRCSAGLRLFSFSPRLEKFEWTHRDREGYKIGDKTVEALIKHSATLEVVRFGGDYVCSWQQIDRLLCSLPKLKEIYFEFNCLNNYGGWLEAGKILDSEWVCLDLEVFGCAIRGIPRPEIPRTPIIQGKVRSGTRQESLDLQRRVYTKLALFTKLRELRSSTQLDEMTNAYKKISKRRVWQYDCLSMTLESGLDVLKDLQNLRVVELWYLDNGIYNAEEKEWVQKNWPKVDVRFKKFYERRR
ncbi:hypothetical protein BGZ89_006770 [Linnemannia elongata]|nr:hypothetical protein BGZ89_006770 [Linnemannia elongata]